MKINFSFINDKPEDGFKVYLKSLPFVNRENLEDIFEFYKSNNEEIIKSNSNSILIKGDVQSGKTNNIIYLMNHHSKNTKYFIFLSGHLNKLNEQNMERIDHAMNKNEYSYSMHNMNSKSLSQHYFDKMKVRHNEGKFIISGIKRIDNFKRIIENISLADPDSEIVIFDDESDSHTISNTFLEYRKNILKRKNVKYYSITATPYYNLYHFSHLYDEFFIYKSHSGYKGLKEFMETKTMRRAKDAESALSNLVVNSFIKKKGTILWNVTRLKREHKDWYLFIKEHLKKLKNVNGAFKNHIESKGLKIDNFNAYVHKLSKNISISNSDHVTNEKGEKIVIGRENMSRGITYEDLIGEYIFMNPQKFNPGKIMQSGRWFGTRQLSQMRIYMNEELLWAYEECLEMDNILLELTILSEFKKKVKAAEFQYLEIRKANNE